MSKYGSDEKSPFTDENGKTLTYGELQNYDGKIYNEQGAEATINEETGDITFKDQSRHLVKYLENY